MAGRRQLVQRKRPQADPGQPGGESSGQIARGRCYALGKALRRSIETWDADARVVVIASGGLSHSVIDEELDWMVLDAMTAKDAEALCALPVDRLIRGTSEIRNWIVVAGAMEPTDMTIVDYVPYYRSPAGTGCAGGFTYWI